MKIKSDQEIINELKQENEELKRIVRWNRMTKEDLYNAIKKLVGKREFTSGLFKMSYAELSDFLNFLEEENTKSS